MTSRLHWSNLWNSSVTMPEAVIAVYLDCERGLLSVEHDGTITWDGLQSVKNTVFGPDACAIEIYPPQGRVVNNAVMRHLWCLGPDDWWPDLGMEGPFKAATLRERIAVLVGRTIG